MRDKLIQFKSNTIFKTIIKEDIVDDIIEKLNVQSSSLYAIIFSEEDFRGSLKITVIWAQTIHKHKNWKN